MPKRRRGNFSVTIQKNVPRLPKPPTYRACIYCGAKPLTRTHIWPVWFRGKLPFGISFTRFGFLSPGLSGSEKRIPRAQFFKKSMFSQAPYLTCKNCNEGWLKRFEDEAKDFLLPILLGDFQKTLSLAETTILIGWLTAMAIHSEYGMAIVKSVDRSTLDHFQANRTPPQTWSLFIGEAEGPIWNEHYIYHNFSLQPVIMLPAELPRSDVPLSSNQSQISSFGINKLFVQLLVCKEQVISDEFRKTAEKIGLIKLWPMPQLPVDLRLIRTLTDDQCGAVTRHFIQRLQQIFGEK